MSDNPLSELGRVLDDLFGVGQEQEYKKNFWGSILNGADDGLNLRGILPQGNNHNPETYSARPNEFSYVDIIKIATERPRPFQVIDVNPQALQSDVFRCSIPPTVLADKVGFSGELTSRLTAAATPAINGQGFVTVPVPLAGTFLRIDKLPNPVNTTWLGVSAATGNLQSFAKAPYYNTISGGSMYRDYVLIQFEDINAPIIIAKAGDCLKLPFSQCFVTTLNTNSRFSITVGYNSEINSPKVVNFDLHTLNGENILEYPNLQPTPFCFTNSETNGNITFNGNGYIFGPGVTEVQRIFTYNIPAGGNPFQPGTPGLKGQAVGWVTEFQGSIAPETGGSVASRFSGEIALCIVDSADNIVSIISSLKIYGQSDAGGTMAPTQNRVFRPSIPHRFTIDYSSNYSLAVVFLVSVGGATNYSIMWTLHGYSMGAVTRFGNATSPNYDYNTPSYLDKI